ncbi:GNAT family N-acetyltransferase [Robiginitalea sp. IMCC43444]|uniref:GNAT family N-acetyltransferase n=1 Tax=Robiginitalea sp. IMCC43444 TaxID=3459121 RepID=UPI00404197A1
MKLIPLIRRNFHLDFYEENKICSVFKKMRGLPNEYFGDKKNKLRNNNAITIINCIPPYLVSDKIILQSEYSSFSGNIRLGYAMLLNEFKNSSEYLREQLGKKVYKNLRQDKQRLEREHELSIQFYHGKIDPHTFEKILHQLKEFIEVRFGGNKHKHYALKRWSLYEKELYKQILGKRASFIVAYSGGDIAGISVNYHFTDNITVALNSFNRDFSGYSMGRLMFWYILDWSYNNNIKLIDLEWGNLPYKIKFSNAVFQYQTQVVYPRKNILLKMLSFGIIQLLVLKNYILQKKDFGMKNPEEIFEGRWLYT